MSIRMTRLCAIAITAALAAPRDRVAAKADLHRGLRTAALTAGSATVSDAVLRDLDHITGPGPPHE